MTPSSPDPNPGRRLGAVHSLHAETHLAVAQVIEELSPPEGAPVFFFVGHGHDLDRVSTLASEQLPDNLVLGCSTAGSLSAPGKEDEGLSAWCLRAPGRAAALWVPDLRDWRFEDARPLVRRLARRLGRRLGSDLLMVVLSHQGGGAESRMLAALSAAAPGVSVVGGEAGPFDPGARGGTFVGCRSGPASAVVCLAEPGVPFHAFACHHFEETDARFVVTAARSEALLLDELDGRPAREVYEEAAGLAPGTLLEPDLGATANAYQLGFRASGALHVRAVFGAEGDSLRLAAPVSDGMVLRLTRAGDLVEATRRGVEQALAQVPGPRELLLFSCLGRRLQAAEQTLDDELAGSMAAAPVAGLACLSEHFGALQVNYTLTGVAFGSI